MKKRKIIEQNITTKNFCGELLKIVAFIILFYFSVLLTFKL
jgi:hypothetical protein